MLFACCGSLVVQDHGCKVPINSGALLFRNKEEDLCAVIDFEVHTGTKKQPVNALQGKMKFHSFAVLGTDIGKTIPVQGTGAVTAVAGQALSGAGQPELHR